MPHALNVRAVLRSPLFWMLCALVLCVLLTVPAHASDASGAGAGGLPWEGPLDKLRRSFSGPVAFTISLLGLIATGATLIWGGEISEFVRRIIYVILVICIIVFANGLLTGALFSGAVVPPGGLALDPGTAHVLVHGALVPRP
jgi:type IV secretion system protein TrbC